MNEIYDNLSTQQKIDRVAVLSSNGIHIAQYATSGNDQYLSTKEQIAIRNLDYDNFTKTQDEKDEDVKVSQSLYALRKWQKEGRLVCLVHASIVKQRPNWNKPKVIIATGCIAFVIVLKTKEIEIATSDTTLRETVKLGKSLPICMKVADPWHRNGYIKTLTWTNKHHVAIFCTFVHNVEKWYV